MSRKKQKSTHLSKRKQTELLRKQGYSYKEINRLKSDNRKQIAYSIIADQKENKKLNRTPKQITKSVATSNSNKKQVNFKNRVTKKRMYLQSIGIDKAMVRGTFSDKQIDSILLKDIENNRVTRDRYPWLFFDKSIDFDQIYKLKNNERMFIAFRDYQGELDFETELQRFANYSNGDLVDGLEAIVNTPATYKRGVSGSSSGRAGDYKFMVAPQEVIELFNKEAYNETRKDKRRLKNQDNAKEKRKKKRQHFKGEKVGFQVLKDGRRNSFNEVTPRNLLIMANAVMYNVTEQNRSAFYNRFYADITSNIPDMKEILPKPKY